MVEISYQAAAQIRRLSPVERRDLRRVLERDELQNQSVQSRIPNRFVARFGTNKRGVGSRTKTAT
jgi:hypothetical protein